MSLPEKPLTRRETYLVKAAGQDVTLPETDLTREEQYLRAIAEGGGGGGTSPFYPAGNTAFASLPELSADILGAMYNITDAFTTDSRFNEGAGIKYPAGTNVAVVNIGTEESPTLKFDTYTGAYTVDDEISDVSENPVQNKVIKSALDGKVNTEQGKSLSTNDYTDADKALVQDSPITVTATGAEITASTAQGNLNALTVYGKSEVVDGAIVSAGDSGSIEVQTYTGTNQFGGLDFATALNNASYTSTIDTVNKTVTYNHRKQTSNYIIYEGGFKPNTQYTVLLTGYNTDNNDSLLIEYTDGTDTHIAINAQLKTTVVTVSTANKTIKAIMLSYYADSLTTLYYDECGIFEGVKTASDFEPYNGTMATFTTGTPLRGIPDTDVRDVMVWDGSSGAVTKNCDEVDLGTRIWTEYGSTAEYTRYVTGGIDDKVKDNGNCLCAKYNSKLPTQSIEPNMVWISNGNAKLSVTTNVNEYASASDFAAAMSGVKLVYELTTPTTQNLTSTENASLAGLRTFAPQTHAQNNAGATMTVEAYAGTANGQAVNELKQDVQSEISALKITQSDTLTLTVAGWSNNAQVIAYAHDTAKRNVIDVDPASVEEWASCGILATAETASGITFTCKAVPTNALTFKVTSMGVN